MTDYVYTEDDIPSVSDPVWRILTGAAAFGIGVFICGSVGSYMPSDPSWNAATDAEVQNLFSGPGAIFADLSRQMLGWSAWAAGLAMMIGGAMRTVLIGVPRVRRWMTGLAFVPLSAAFFAAWPVPESWPLSAGLGGVVGDALFYYASMPFRALLLPSPNTWAGAVLGAASAWAALSALGFRRRDAHLLHQAATKSGRHAARQATGIGGFLVSVVSFLKPKPRDLDDEELDADRDTGRARVIKGDDEYVDADSYDVDYDDEDEVYDEEDETSFDDEDLYEDEDDGIAPIQTRRLSVPVSKPKLPSQPRVTKSDRRRKSTRLPSIDLLQMPEERGDTVDEDALLEKAARLTDVLKEFGVRGRIKEVRPGPVITLFEMEPAPGVKSSRVISLADDIARSMSAISARVAVVPGKNAIGIELPNEDRDTVYLRTLLQAEAYVGTRASLPMALGEDIGGVPTVVDLSKMPHLLIAGTDPKKAVNALQWTVREMEGRYELMSKAGVRNLAGFNDKAAKYRANGDELVRKVQTGFDERGKPIYETESLPTDHIPNIVVVIDEMADLMMVAGKEIEGCVQRLAQMARAAGIHLITATQRPSVDVITGTIKANFPTRISYMVTTKIDSRTILGEQGAEQLLGMGDLLYQAPGKKSQRLHGPFVSDEEVGSVVDWLKEQGEPDYVMDVLEAPEDGSTGSAVMDAMLGTSTGDEDDDLYSQALAIVVRDQRASTSYLQRRLKIGYNKAAGVIDRLEEEGAISAPNHAGKREVLASARPSPE